MRLKPGLANAFLMDETATSRVLIYCGDQIKANFQGRTSRYETTSGLEIQALRPGQSRS